MIKAQNSHLLTLGINFMLLQLFSLVQILGFESEKYIIIQILSRKLRMIEEVCSNDRTNGRWTKEEHEKFMLGLKLYGKNWKKIEELVVTRNGSQIRSHAQKYFMKLNYKPNELHEGVQNRDPETHGMKDKEITTKISNKKLIKLPTLDSPSFWPQISQLIKTSSFSFWDLIQQTGTPFNNQSCLKYKQKSFVPYEQNEQTPLKDILSHSNI